MKISRDQTQASTCHLPVELYEQHLILPGKTKGVTTYIEYCQPGKFTEPQCSGFYWGQSRRHGAPLWMIFISQPPGPPEVKLIEGGHDPNHKSHCQYKPSGGVQGRRETLTLLSILTRSQRFSQEPVEGETSLWNRQGLNTPGLLHQTFTGPRGSTSDTHLGLFMENSVCLSMKEREHCPTFLILTVKAKTEVQSYISLNSQIYVYNA